MKLMSWLAVRAVEWYSERGELKKRAHREKKFFMWISNRHVDLARFPSQLESSLIDACLSIIGFCEEAKGPMGINHWFPCPNIWGDKKGVLSICREFIEKLGVQGAWAALALSGSRAP